MLTCKEFLSWLNEYLCESTDLECKKHVEEHVNACPNCWVIFDTTKKTIQVFKGQNQTPEAVPQGVQSRLMAALQRKMATGAKPPGGCSGAGPSRPN
ncbi:MAG: anti-sigma factor [Acidobacteria bacterium]|nr:anti-sigma factor [Acidobacteriota bacterium]